MLYHVRSKLVTMFTSILRSASELIKKLFPLNGDSFTPHFSFPNRSYFPYHVRLCLLLDLKMPFPHAAWLALSIVPFIAFGTLRAK